MILIKLTLVPLGLFYAAALAGVFLMQRQLQYAPGRADPAPVAVGLTGVRAATLATPDGETLVLWYAPAQGTQPTILFFHGNAGTIADRAARMSFYQSKGFGAAFLSYRGFGGSTGTPTEAGLMTDAHTAYAFLAAQGVAPGKIVVLGESLGTGVAVQLAASLPVGAVILEAPYTAAVDIAARVYPWLPVRLLMKDQFASAAHIAMVTAPLLVMHGTEDTVIPLAFGQRLFAAANAPKLFHSVQGAGHEALFSPATWAIEADFIASTLPP
jgi:uncharacterized protein